MSKSFFQQYRRIVKEVTFGRCSLRIHILSQQNEQLNKTITMKSGRNIFAETWWNEVNLEYQFTKQIYYKSCSNRFAAVIRDSESFVDAKQQ